MGDGKHAGSDAAAATVKEGPRLPAPTVNLGSGNPARAAEDPPVTSAFDPLPARFESRGELGRGGMGRVDDAYDRSLARPVAIKHMLSTTDVDLARFEREARITARLEHPGIVPIHDAGRGADGTPYYVMRRIDGQPLADLVAGKSLAQRLALLPNMLAACDAVAFAHARGIVHRDLKPTNILVGPFGETLVIDWGLAREIADDDRGGTVMPSDPQLTRAGTIAGTPGFMSPEQARGERVDERADVFALGANLFFVLTGQLAYAGTSATELVAHAGAGRPPDWRLVPREVPDDLRAILMKAMASGSADRYRDAGAVAADLRQFVTGNLVAAYEYGRFTKVARFVRRHRAAVAVACVSLVVLAIVATISVRRVVAERDDANAARALAEQRQREATNVADGLLIQNARQLAESDPIAAIAALRTLRPESTRWPEAWAAAATAWANGIPFGFVSDGPPSMIQISPDSRLALSTSIVTGKVAIYDLVLRTRQKLPIDNVFSAAWLDAKHVACVVKDHVAIIEIATGAVRSTPIDALSLFGNRQSRVWIITTTNRMLELDSPTGELHEIAAGFDDYSMSPDLTTALFRRGAKVEWWTRTRTWPIPNLDGDVAYMTASGDHAAILDHGGVRELQLRDDGVVEIGRWPNNGYRQLAFAANKLYADSLQTLVVLTDTGARDVGVGAIEMMWMTQRGILASRSDGSIWIHDSDGWFEVGRRPTLYRRLDLSSDGRFIFAITDPGDLIAFDLDQFRPRTVALRSQEVPIRITDRAVWTLEDDLGLQRHDLVTGQDRTIIESSVTQGWGTVSPDERWATIYDEMSRKLVVYDATIEKTLRLATAVNATTVDRDALLYVREDGTVWRWQAGWDAGRRIAAVSPGALMLGAAGNYVVVSLAGTTLERVELTSGAIARTTLATAHTHLAVAPNGTAWFLSEGVVWRWDVGASSPRRVDTPEPIDDLTVMSKGVITHSSKSLIEVGDNEPRVFPINSRRWSVGPGDLIAISGTRGNVSVFDVITGLSVSLPLAMVDTQAMLMTGNRVAYVYTLRSSRLWGLAIWTIPVPREPAELRRWLGDVTNARRIPNSKVVAWP